MNRPDKNSWLAYLPYACSFVAIPICYLSVLLSTGQQMLAACATIVCAVAVFVLCRMVQNRGQVSLAVLIFVFPLLIAGSSLIYLRLTSFFNRQQSVEILRNGNVGFWASRAVRTDEWLRDSKGAMLPVWFANSIGNDCLSIVVKIEAELNSIQAINLNKLDRSEIRRVHLTQTEIDGHLTDKLIDWLNRCPNLEEVQLTFRAFSSLDGQALSRLKVKKQITLFDCHLVTDLSSLSDVKWAKDEQLKLIGANLSDRVAGQLSQFAIPRLELECELLSPNTVRSFQGFQGNLAVVRGVTLENIREFATLGRDSIELSNIAAVPVATSVNADNMPQTKVVVLGESSLSVDDCKNFAALFQCEELWLSDVLYQDASNSKRFDLECLGEVQVKDLTPLWESPSLKRIFPNNDPRKVLTRPIPNRSQ